MSNIEQVNALGDILNTTFGKSSSQQGDRSVTGVQDGDTLVLKFMSVVQFASEHSLKDQTDRISEESVKVLHDAVKSIKKDFKAKTGTALKLKDDSSYDNVEVVSGSIHSPRKIAYYRRTHTLTIKE